MTAGCPAASRAWTISLVLHTAAGFAAVVAALWPSSAPSRGLGPPIDTRSMSVSLVLLEPPTVPAVAADPAPAPLPPVRAEPIAPPKLNATPENPVRPVEHTEPPSGPPAGSATLDNPKPSSDPLPPGAATIFCGVPTIGASVVFVIDRSASMGLEGRFERARREVAASLRRLPPTARFQVIAYHRAPTLLSGRGLVLATPSSVAAAVDALERLVPEGGTDHSAALRAALTLKPDVICFLTDDDDLTFEQVREVTKLNRSGTCIHALCFVEPFGPTAMPLLAKQNRGEFRVIR